MNFRDIFPKSILDSTEKKISILPIKTEYAQRIYLKTKKYEFRKCAPRNSISHILLYETSPIQMVTGYFTIKEIHQLHPKMLWEKCSNTAGITHEKFMVYFKDRPSGIALEINQAFRFQAPFHLSQIKKGLSAPQSYIYL